MQAYIFGFGTSGILAWVLSLTFGAVRVRSSKALPATSLALNERDLDEVVLWLRASSVPVLARRPDEKSDSTFGYGMGAECEWGRPKLGRRSAA